MQFCRNVFSNSSMPMANNATLICLVPKTTNADNIRSFRPIDLCNTSYKLITKIIVNRIKPYLPSLISPT